METGNLISRSAAALVIVLFFLPWVTVSCDGTEVLTMTGYDLAAGKEVGMFGQTTEADPLMFLIPAAAIGALLVSFSVSSTESSGKYQFSLGVLGLVIIFLKWIAMASNQDQVAQGIDISVRYGAWGSLGALILLLFGAWEVWHAKPSGASRASPALNRPSQFPQSQPGNQQSRARPALNRPTQFPQSQPGNQQPQQHEPAGLANLHLDEKKCANCARYVDKKAKFCSYCGFNLVGAPAAETAPVSDMVEAVAQTDRADSLTEEEQVVLAAMGQGALRAIDISRITNLSAMDIVSIQRDLCKRYQVENNLELAALANTALANKDEEE